MRQGQQNRRGRGRNNNNNNNSNHNRKSQNPLTRSFESAGPDVKLRGTPSHIAEKYITLARDALSSGDRVLAENYLQHAEHYNRIIMTYREQQISQGGVDPFNAGGARTHSLNSPDGSEGEEFSDEDGGDDTNQGNGNGHVQPPQMMRGDGGAQQGDGQPRQFDPPQQRYDNRPQRSDHRNDNRYNNPRHDRGDNNRYDRNDRNDRRGNDFRGDRQDRPDRQDRFAGNSNDNRGFRDDRRPHNPSFEGQPSDGNGFRRRDRFSNSGHANGGDRDRGPVNAEPFERERPVAAAAPIASPPPPPVPPVAAAVEQEQPAFLRRPVRRPRRDDAEAKPAAAPREPASED